MVEELPQVLRLAWNVPGPRRSGPRPALSVEAIVGGAVELADEGGLDACSMPKLAKHLGIGTMSLYRYVSDKTELTVLMRDAAIGRAPTRRPGDDWRATLRVYAAGLTERYREHPWVLDVPIPGFPSTPRVLSWLELGLLALDDLHLSDEQRLASVLLLDGHVSATARIARTDRSATRGQAAPRDLVAEHFPTVARALTTTALGPDPFADDGLAFGVERIIESIDGLARRAEETASP